VVRGGGVPSRAAPKGRGGGTSRSRTAREFPSPSVTRTAWEYLSLSVVIYGETKWRTKPGSSEEESYVDYQYKWWVIRPSVAPADAEELHHGQYGDTTEAPFDRLAYFNRLGREGWELVDHTIPRSGINTHHVGWATTSEPMQESYLFKRPLTEEDVR
jgi:hypothetical protein